MNFVMRRASKYSEKWNGEINSLEELTGLIKKYGDDLVIGRSIFSEGFQITIYDDYLE